MFDISNKFIEQLAKTDITQKIQNQVAFKDSQLPSKLMEKEKEN